MKELIDRILANGLADLEGLEVTGSVPVKQAILNEAITAFLAEATSDASGASASPAADIMPTGDDTPGGEKPKGGRLPIKTLLGLVKRAEVEAVEGKVILHFTIRR
ncbi:MAG: hypothetical protein SFU56_00335 [Capsulimonadales bacterium]|nr:hypothetical protein [Capsulimonadales bacterium]